jgi:hypothetical protein
MGLARTVLEGPNEASREVGKYPLVCYVLTEGTRPVSCRTTLLPPERGEKASQRSPLTYGCSVPFATKAAAPPPGGGEAAADVSCVALRTTQQQEQQPPPRRCLQGGYGRWQGRVVLVPGL